MMDCVRFCCFFLLFMLHLCAGVPLYFTIRCKFTEEGAGHVIFSEVRHSLLIISY